MKKRNILLRVGILLGFGMMPAMAWAQEAATNAGGLMPGISNSTLLIIILISTFALLLSIFAVLSYVTYALISPLSASAEAVSEESTLFWDWFWNKFNAAKPLSKEKDILMGHEYDGIRELDNDLPPWWKYGFYLTIVFSVVYMYAYHFGNSDDISTEEFLTESAELEAMRAAYLSRAEGLVDETNAIAMEGKADLDAGAALFSQHCKSCHGAAGGGGIGPNLTDVYWLHGGGIKNVFKTIKVGVPEKGMISWKDKLTPKQILQVGSFIVKLQGTNPPNGLEPQGEKYEEK